MAVNRTYPSATAAPVGLSKNNSTVLAGEADGYDARAGGRIRLRAQRLAAFRGERLVLREVDFGIAAGGGLLVLGPNGSGKSTLLRLLAGLRRPDAGRITWDGEDIAADRGAHAARVAYIGHLDALKPTLTGSENLAFDARLGHGDVTSALADLDLDPLAAIPARMLSAGQRRRLALARLSLTQAPLWLLDEPTVGLDAVSIGRFCAMLAAHCASGGIVIAATHVSLPIPGAAEVCLG
jgi:heme exporter protein A